MQPPFSFNDAARMPPMHTVNATHRSPTARVGGGAAAGIAVAAAIVLAALLLAVILLVRGRRKTVRAAYMKHVEIVAGGAFPGAAGGTSACLRLGGCETVEETQRHQLRVAKVIRHLDRYRGGDVLLLRQYELLPRDLLAVGGALR